MLPERYSVIGFIVIWIFPKFAKEYMPLLLYAMFFPKVQYNILNNWSLDIFQDFITMLKEHLSDKSWLSISVHECYFFKTIDTALKFTFGNFNLLKKIMIS